MRVKTKLVQSFLTNRDETGRFIVKSIKSGRVYFIEPIHSGKIIQWGDIDPASKKVTGSYGKKYTGAIREKESMITAENGFDKIQMVNGSPFHEIEKRDQIYLDS